MGRPKGSKNRPKQATETVENVEPTPTENIEPTPLPSGRVSDEPTENVTEPSLTRVYKKSDVIAARQLIRDYKKQKTERPKRKCTDKQLAALAAGRQKNSRFKARQTTDN